MASKDRPGPAFIALRAAALGVDDLSRLALRQWVMGALDHRGQIVLGESAPTEDASIAIVAAILTLTDSELDVGAHIADKVIQRLRARMTSGSRPGRENSGATGTSVIVTCSDGRWFDSSRVLAVRARRQRCLLAMILFSSPVFVPLRRGQFTEVSQVDI